MAEIGFYHLTRSALGQALPQLLGRTLAAGQRALVLCKNNDQLTALDKALWQATEPDWLPHGTPADGDADLQPIFLSTSIEAANGARFLFLTGGADLPDLTVFERVFDLFDGNQELEILAARQRWKAVKAAGHVLTYWQQGPHGWAKKV